MDSEEIRGVIDRFLFRNEENGYTVFSLVQGRTSITVTGNLVNINPGQEITAQGKWKFHPKFGKQFEATSCSVHLPSTPQGLKKYLGSGLIKGIGKVYAEKLVTAFGTDVLHVIDKQPELLQKVPGIGPGRAEKIIQGWQSQKEISKIMLFLQDHGASPAYAAKIYKQYGHNAVAVVQENPYKLIDDIWGIGFKIADHIAQQLGFSHGSVQRIKAGILHAISTIISSGHLYIELNELKKIVRELLELTDEHEATIKTAFHDLYNAGTIKLITYPQDSQHHYITLAQYYYSEKGLAARLLELIERPSTLSFNIDAIYQSLRAQEASTIFLNDDQQQGIMACLQNKVTIITGGPGTGKTTLIKKLLDILDDNRINYKLAAPTGRAAKRIMEGTHRFALTLHRLLEFDFASMSFVHNEQNALKLDYLIIDEASMIDIFLAHAIAKALPLHAHVVFIGDVDQLPSVGPGNFLNDLIQSGKVTTVQLKHIFRQAADSLIVVNAHRVNTGEFPTSYLPDAKKDFIYIKENNPEMVTQHLTTIYQQILPRHHIKPEDSMVLVPMHRGVVGTQKLNHDLQTMLNPAQGPSIARAGTSYKVGDRIMQIKNNYDKGMFNGDVSTIIEIDEDNRIMHVQCDERKVEYEFEELDEVVLAYSVSIHKSQGSEYPAVIIPIFMQHFTLLARNLVYTAITRAKKLCILIGQPKAIAMAIKNNKGTVRTTFFKQFLTSDLQCRS